MNPTPIPFPNSATASPSSSYVAILADDRAVMHLVGQLIERAGVTQAEIARRLGVEPQSVNQVYRQRRKRPTIQWLAKLAAACGAKILVEFPLSPLEKA